MSQQEATIEQHISNVEQAIKSHRRDISRMEMLSRLEQNPDFKALIMDGFLEDHAVRQVLLKAHPGMQREETMWAIDQQITAIGGLKQFFVGVFTKGQEAKIALESDEETLEELHAEALAGGEGTDTDNSDDNEEG